MEVKNEPKEVRQSMLLTAFSRGIEWGSQWLTLSRWALRSDQDIFIKLEFLMLAVTAFCASVVFYVHQLPQWAFIAISALFVQRIIEFFVIYSRNFILNRGRIYSHFHDERIRGQWLLLMFSMNILQIIFIFAAWYRYLSLGGADFSQVLNVVDSIYFSTNTFIMVGLGDIFPLSSSAKILVIIQNILTFYTLVVVLNGLISMHFKSHR
jgi:hypothetical protein